MFDIVFIFFLFLVGVTCILYYLPPSVRKSAGRHRSHSASNNKTSDDDNYCRHQCYHSPNISHHNTTNISRCDYEIYYKRRRSTYTNELAAQCNDLSAYESDSSAAFSPASSSQQQKTKSVDCVVRVNENYVCVSSSSNNIAGGDGNSDAGLATVPPQAISQCELIEMEIERTNNVATVPAIITTSKSSNYVKAKDFDIKNCNGPIFDV